MDFGRWHRISGAGMFYSRKRLDREEVHHGKKGRKTRKGASASQQPNTTHHHPPVSDGAPTSVDLCPPPRKASNLRGRFAYAPSRIPFFCVPLRPLGLKGINEVMASNGTTLADEDGDFEDWIELYNDGTEPVDLSGWGLSDSYSNPFKWTFPEDTVLGAGEYLLVWASGKDRVTEIGKSAFALSFWQRLAFL